MKVFVFGNQDFEADTVAIKAAEELKDKLKNIEFVVVRPNEDLPFAGEKNVVLMDGVAGIKKTTMITEKDLDKLSLTKSVTAHDFDLGFQLKYLQKLGKLKKITIIGLPINKKINLKNLTALINKVCRVDSVSTSKTNSKADPE